MADASSEPKLAQVETELATKPLHGDEKKEETATETAPVCICAISQTFFCYRSRTCRALKLTIADFD